MPGSSIDLFVLLTIPFLDFGSHAEVLSAYFRICTQEPLLVVFGGHNGMLGIKPWFAMCKASTLPVRLSLWPLDHTFFFAATDTSGICQQVECMKRTNGQK